MRKYVRSIRVEDASGAQFDVHEFATGPWIWKRRLFELESGEPACLVDDHCFALVSTGEPLLRID